MFLAGQISTRLGWFDTLTVVVSYTLLMVLFWFIGFIIVAAVPPASGQAACVVLFWIPYFCAFIFLMLLRQKFVERFQIREDPIETLCVGFWCSPCSLCQMARHLYGYTRQFDGDGLLDGTMNYQGGGGGGGINAAPSFSNVKFSNSSNPLYVPSDGATSNQYPNSLQAANSLPSVSPTSQAYNNNSSPAPYIPPTYGNNSNSGYPNSYAV